MMSSPVSFLRLVSFVEGLSWLVLLFIAMPLKYAADQPMAVSYAGRAHGGLFVLFCVALVVAWKSKKWAPDIVTLLFVSSLFPFGFIFAERWLKKQSA